MLSNQTKFTLKYYNGLFKDRHTKYRAHGGVAIFSYEIIPYHTIALKTPLQTPAARIDIGKNETIVSVNSS